jgi:hypothetical protein
MSKQTDFIKPAAPSYAYVTLGSAIRSPKNDVSATGFAAENGFRIERRGDTVAISHGGVTTEVPWASVREARLA